ncbi:unnamed protein product [Effrenium voratum]|uniref:J domain-containing protein n=1 Tax=Effrenium voratum TaxID=2562239 RepID=A0AA36NKF5_9DINO|nr:unnamed protein product [Effrenium voratum]CAJ1423346.1 unnamed protein product [Effrenium voratum]
MAAPIFSASHAAKQGSREVRRILRARSHLACLDFDEAPEPAELKKSYRRLSLLVHPDKCQETDAKAAFQKLSEAFEALRESASDERPAKRQNTSTRWWDTTWEEFERRFRHREKGEAAREAEFDRGVKAQQSLLRLQERVASAEKVVENLDRRTGLGSSSLWPRRPEQDAQAAEARLRQLLTHLRTRHRYCLYCGRNFDSPTDLLKNCPGFSQEEHERSKGARDAKKPETREVMKCEDDPLDEFMFGMEDQLTKDMKKSVKSMKTRHMPQKGWSFQQQAQQNKMEAKRRGGR